MIAFGLTRARVPASDHLEAAAAAREGRAPRRAVPVVRSLDSGAAPGRAGGPRLPACSTSRPGRRGAVTPTWSPSSAGLRAGGSTSAVSTRELRGGATLVVNRFENYSAARAALVQRGRRGSPGGARCGQRVSLGWRARHVRPALGHARRVRDPARSGRKRWRVYPPTLPLPLGMHRSEGSGAACPPTPVLDCVLESGRPAVRAARVVAPGDPVRRAEPAPLGRHLRAGGARLPDVGVRRGACRPRSRRGGR